MRESREKPTFGTRIKEVTWKSRYPDTFRFEGADWTVTGFTRATGSDTITIHIERSDDGGSKFYVQRKIPKNATREELLSR